MNNVKIAEQLVKLAKEMLSDDYQEYFEDKMDDYKVDSPTEIPDDKKDDFFEDVDKGWDSEEEKSKKISSPLIDNVAKKFGIKIAEKLHSEVLRQATKYLNDERLQNGSSLESIVDTILESATKRINGLNRMYK